MSSCARSCDAIVSMQQSKTPLLAVLAACVALMPAAVMAQASYEYQVISYPGGSGTFVGGITDQGIAVGYGYTSQPTGPFYPFVHDIRRGTFTDVANVDGLPTFLFGASDSGRLVGNFSREGASVGVIRDRNGANTIVSHPDAVSYTSFRGVNSRGLISGQRDTALAVRRNVVGFVYDPDAGTFTDFAPSLSTTAHGINVLGDVVGAAMFRYGNQPEDPCPDLPGSLFARQYGLLRAADGALTYFRVNGQSTQARGINDRGQIVGWTGPMGFVIDGKQLAGATCIDISVAAADLLQVPDSTSTLPYGITNSGVIVGGFIDATGPHSFVATPR